MLPLHTPNEPPILGKLFHTITCSGVTRGFGGGRTAPGDTLQGVTPKWKSFVGKFTKNSGETRSDG